MVSFCLGPVPVCLCLSTPLLLTLIRPFLAFFRSVVFKQPFCLHCVQLRPVVPAAALRARPCFLGLLQCPPGLPRQPGRSDPVTLGLPFLVMTFHFFPFLSSLPAGSSLLKRLTHCPECHIASFSHVCMPLEIPACPSLLS